ncbi:MAG TPA: DUF4331 family protein [Chthoniobacteraceae bacterium]|jgi:hypothetical protein|nr:DUF4331 family protein [Chthoniobacteraceae bacterium]
MKTLLQGTRAVLTAAILLTGSALLPPAVRAADHGDAPALAHDAAADIADLYFFMDPNQATKDNVIVIGTFHGFIVPGEAGNFAVFDENVKYRFQIYNQHVNSPLPAANATAAQKAAFALSILPNRFIDVTFNKRAVTATNDAQINLRKPDPQTATVTMVGFNGSTKPVVFTLDGLKQTKLVTTPVTLAAAPASQVIDTIVVDPANAAKNIQFFAGEVDDPFFFDLVSFSRSVKAIHDDGNLNNVDFSRARDTFAGYNVLSIAFSIPKSLLLGTNGVKLGADFLTLRHALEVTTANGKVGSGPYRTVDRMGNPAVNVALIPFNLKDSYNATIARTDASGKFVPAIVDTITQLHLNTSAANIGVLAGIAVSRGDILQLDTSLVNSGPNGGDNANVGFPNGRRLKDDVIDTILTVLNNNAHLGDGVDASDVLPTSAFPFVAPPQQPRASGVLDDNTRN